MKNRLPCLDGLRGIAILIVLCSHGLSTINHTLPSWFSFIFTRGELGVFVFFILSGFLITYLLQSEYKSSGTISLRNFYLRRVLRIFPAFYTYLLVLALLSLFGCIQVALSHFIEAGLFLWNYQHMWDSTSGGQGYWYLGHFWTLSLEEQFYLLWPLTFLLLRMRLAAWLALALIIFMPFVRLGSYFLFPELRGQLIMMLHTGADSLMFGCLLALLIRHEKMNKFLDYMASPYWPLLAGMFAWLISPLIATSLPGHFEGGYSTTLGRSLTGFSIAFIIAWLLRYPGCLVGRLLNSAPMVHIGVLSYSLYLWQQLFLTPLNRTWTGEFPFNLGCAYVAAWLCHTLVEKPFLKLKDKFAQKPLRATPAVPKAVDNFV
jgi:peptidoglycan/LPS O-acetylase OafA/YrhL